MRSLTELKSFSKNQATYHERKAAEKNLQPYQIKKHREAAEGLNDIHAFLESLPSDITADKPPQNGPDIFELDPFRLDDIPDDLVEELKIGRAEKADAQILELFRIAHRPLNISEVLIGLFRKFNESEKRTAVSARLYRLAQANEITPVEGERGVYKLMEKKSPQV